MHVVIMGCGRVGSTLAHSLESRGHSVAVIAQDADAFRRLGPDFAGITVTGAGFDDQRRAQVYERLGIPTVATVRWTADRMLRHLVPEGNVEIFRDPTSTVSIIEVPVHKDWIGRPLRQLEQAVGARVAYLNRFGIGTLPTASTVIQEGDQVYMLVTDDINGPVTSVAAAPPEGGH